MYTRRLLYDHGQKMKQLEYWNEMLKDLPVLDMPLDHSRPLVLSSKGARIPVSIPRNLVIPFTDLMAEANSNLFVGLLSLYMSLLHVWGGGDKFRYVMEYHNALSNIITAHIKSPFLSSIGVAMANRQVSKK